MQFKSLQEIVDDILVTMQDKQRDAAIPMTRIAVNVLQELNWTALPTVLRKEITVGTNLTAPVPPDLIDVISVDMIGVNGTPQPLSKIRYIHTNIKKNCATDTATSETAEDAVLFWDDYLGEMYGIAEDTSPGEYNYNEYERRIEFSSDKVSEGDTFILVYKTSNTSYQQIPMQFYQVIRHRCLMEFYEATNPQKSIFHQRRLITFLADLKTAKKSHTIEDWIQAIYGTYKSSPK